MKSVLSLAFGIYTVLSYAQQGCSFQYAISEKSAGKILYSLNILSKAGNTRSEYRDVNTGQIINTSLKLKRRSDIWYNILGSTFLEIPDQRLKSYKVSVSDTETVNGYKCTKVFVTVYKGAEPVTIWLSKDIPDYVLYLDAEVSDMNLTKLNDALKEKNAGGIPVRIEGKGEMIQVLELVSVKLTNLEDSLFEVKEKQKGNTSDELKKRNEITEEQYQMMKVEEERARQEYEKNKQKKETE